MSSSPRRPPPAAGIDPDLRAHLVCPVCRGELTDEPEALHCAACGLRYPIVDDVPHLLPELADMTEPAPR